MLRLFVGLSLPEEVRERLEEVEDRLPGARWLPSDSYHITLRFIGEVDGITADDIDDALQRLRGQSFDLSLKGLGFFGEGLKARALWAKVEKTEPLLRLQQKVENALQRTGLRPEGRRYTPHVTLARLKNTPGPALEAFVARHSLLHIGPFSVSDFVLYRSFLTGEGAIYREEAIYPLAA